MQPSPESGPSASQLRLFDEAVLCGGFAPRLWLALRGWWLSVTGEKSLAEWAPLVLAELRRRFAANEATAQKVAAEAARLFRFWAVNGAETWDDPDAELTLAWCWTPRARRGGGFGWVKQSTARNRQWAALEVCKAAAELGAPIDPRALIGERIARPTAYTSARPLTDDEDRLVRERAESALAWSGLGVLVAAARSGGTAKELAALRLSDVDLEAATVAFGGPAPRVNPLDGWSMEMMRRFLANQRRESLTESDLLCVSDESDSVRAAHSVTVRLGGVLRDAGLKALPGVSARSIRLTTARRVLDSAGIEAAARFLGVPSLDTAAAALRHDWRRGDG